MNLRSFLLLLFCIFVAADNGNIAFSPRWRMLPQDCGKSKENAFRIYGGADAKLGEFPWLARIFVRGTNMLGFNCGGALISRQHVLTAAHCGHNNLVMFVRVGEYDISTNPDCDLGGCAPKHQDVPVAHYLHHPNWNLPTLTNDIALITLARKVDFNDYVQPICLPLHSIFFEGHNKNTEVQLAGWGYWDVPEDENDLPEILQSVNLEIQPMGYCHEQYQGQFPLAKQAQLCIGVANGKDTCGGDSGGPVMQEIKVEGEYRYFIIGIVSYGPEDCGTGPAVYTRVFYHLNWILQNL